MNHAECYVSDDVIERIKDLRASDFPGCSNSQIIEALLDNYSEVDSNE